MLTVGIKGSRCLTVDNTNTACALSSGALPVFATPAMAALMEATAAKSVAPLLEDGMTSVGTRLELSHISADPTGVTVICESELTEVDGRRLVFKITVRDRKGIVGECVHERYIVNIESFMKRAEAKRAG